MYTIYIGILEQKIWFWSHISTTHSANLLLMTPSEDHCFFLATFPHSLLRKWCNDWFWNLSFTILFTSVLMGSILDNSPTVLLMALNEITINFNSSLEVHQSVCVSYQLHNFIAFLQLWKQNWHTQQKPVRKAFADRHVICYSFYIVLRFLLVIRLPDPATTSPPSDGKWCIVLS